MPKLSEFFQQIVNDAWDEESLPSGRHIDKAVQTLMCLFFFCWFFLFPSALIKDTPQSAEKKQKRPYKCPSGPEMSRQKKNRGKKNPLGSYLKQCLKKIQFRQASPSKISLYLGRSMNHGICSKVTFCITKPKITEWNISDSAKTGDEFCFLFFFPLYNISDLLISFKSRQTGNQGYCWNLGSYCWWSYAYLYKVVGTVVLPEEYPTDGDQVSQVRIQSPVR